jgi:hypothetical protein
MEAATRHGDISVSSGGLVCFGPKNGSSNQRRPSLVEGCGERKTPWRQSFLDSTKPARVCTETKSFVVGTVIIDRVAFHRNRPGSKYSAVLKVPQIVPQIIVLATTHIGPMRAPHALHAHLTTTNHTNDTSEKDGNDVLIRVIRVICGFSGGFFRPSWVAGGGPRQENQQGRNAFRSAAELMRADVANEVS